MQKLIAWLLETFTDFRVNAWNRGRIAGITSDHDTRQRLSLIDYGMRLGRKNPEMPDHLQVVGE